ncbi:MAG: HAD family phosphatase [Deltaproteobacteria bacterium]|nr:HAD family phosphatase [Deltaproteobacteria bacterium]
MTSTPIITALVFDMDGLMLDTEPIYRASWQRAAAELGWEITDEGYEVFLGRRTEDAEADLVRIFGPTFPIDRFHVRWPALWHEIAAAGLTVKPGVRTLLALAAERGLPLGLATSTERRLATRTLGYGGLSTDPFRVVVTGDEIAHGKPAPDIYSEAARRLGIAPERCAAFEDSDAGTLSASRAGMTTFQVPDMKAPSPEACAAAYRVLRSLEEVPPLLIPLITRRDP